MATLEDQKKYNLPAIVPYNGKYYRGSHFGKPCNKAKLYDGLICIEWDDTTWIIAPLWEVTREGFDSR